MESISNTHLSQELYTSIEEYLRYENDILQREDLLSLIKKAELGNQLSIDEVQDRFQGYLQFGTAGLRSQVSAGTNRMNIFTVQLATWSLIQYFNEQGCDKKLVIGFDARLHSRLFAEHAASIAAGLDWEVYIFRTPIPTPLTAYAIRKYKASAGIMITASHNPPADNGFKAFNQFGSQIISPDDKGIESWMSRFDKTSSFSVLDPWEATLKKRRFSITEELIHEYIHTLTNHFIPSSTTHKRLSPLKIVYTAMHGVGHRYAIQALHKMGYDGIIDEPIQVDPDGHFRSVAFPNPEEPGALQLAIKKAQEVQADVVLANDPDADRLAVVIKNTQGQYVTCSGNEIGIALCVNALSTSQIPIEKRFVVTTLVSSTLLGHIAHTMGAHYAETKTGFKWIAQQALQAEKQGYSFLAGYEEALGYLIGTHILDKDGINALVHMVNLLQRLHDQGLTLFEYLDSLYIQYGFPVTHQWSLTYPTLGGAKKLKQTMAFLRKHGIQTLYDDPVDTMIDHSKTEMQSDILVFNTKNKTRLIIRPSGTEPKLKFYLESLSRVSHQSELALCKKQTLEKMIKNQKYLTELLSQ